MTLPIYNDQIDDTPVEQAEVAFTGVNRVVKASMLPEGTLARARNIRIDASGAAATRPGARFLKQLDQTPIDGAKTTRIQGCGYYDSADVERIMLARQGRVVSMDSAGTVVDLGVSISGTAAVTFEQLVTRIFWIDGTSLMWGSNAGAGWTTGSVALMKSGAGTIAMPAFKILRAHRFRLFGVPGASDSIYPSAIGQAHTSGASGDWDELAAVRVGDGDGDPITALMPGQASLLTVLKEGSIWEVDTTALSSASWSIRKITGLTGCVAGRTAVRSGQDLIFLSRYGVVTLGSLERTDSISTAATLSAAIQPLIDRINWTAITTAHAVQYRDMYLLFVPLDGATQPNTCLPFNLTTRQWLDEWTWALTAQQVDAVDSAVIVDETAATMTDELGNPITDYGIVMAAWDGFSCSGLTRFAGKEETILGDTCGRIFRLDESLLDDQQSATVTANIEAFLMTRAWDFGFPRNRKIPFNAELELMDSTSVNLTALLVRNGKKPYPETPLAQAEVIAEGFSALETTRIPVSLPLSLEVTTQTRRAWMLREYAPFREAQVQVISASGQIGLRGIRLSALIDTIQLNGATSANQI